MTEAPRNDEENGTQKSAPEDISEVPAAAEPAPEDVTEAPVAQESAQEPAGQRPAEESQPISEQELRQKLEEHFREQDVSDVLMQFLIGLSTLAYVKMGLTEDTQAFKDLQQASLALDSFKAVLDAASSRLPQQDAKALAGALASMQITFAKASGEKG